jgi:membrane fusion protein, multidrug efflux system
MFSNPGMRPIPLFVFVAVILALPACGKKGTSSVPPPRPVTAARAVTQDVPFYFDEIGNCTAVEAVNIQSQVAGQITEIHFTDGADVKQGDLLFTIDPRPYKAALDKARATLAQDQAKLAYQKAQVARAEELQMKRVMATQDLDQARATRDEQLAVVQSDQASIETAQLNLDYCSIRSPIDGRLGKRLVDRGNIVAYPGGPVLLSITRQNPTYLDFTIAEAKLPIVREYLKRGALRVEASFGSERANLRVGEFSFFDNTVQPGNGTVRLRAVVPNDDRLFWPGQFVSVRLILDTLKNAVLVPSQAVQVGQIGNFVFIIKPDYSVELRPVKAGQKQGDQVVISEGLQAGETVVVTGQLFLAPGAKVTVANADALNKPTVAEQTTPVPTG